VSFLRVGEREKEIKKERKKRDRDEATKRAKREKMGKS
jgi:hypothetical protein